MKITFTKPHLNYAVWDSIYVSIEQANYFVLIDIAKISTDENESDLDIDEPKKRGRKPNPK